LDADVEAVIVTELVPVGVSGKGGGVVPQPTTARPAHNRAVAVRIIHIGLIRDAVVLLRRKTQRSRQLPIAIRLYGASAIHRLRFGSARRDVFTSVVIVKVEVTAAAPFGVMMPGLKEQVE
jgi:hypothetical protein